MPPKRFRAPVGREEIEVRLGGDPLPAFAGEPLAAAVLASGRLVFSRSVKYHRPRGAPCGGGHCSHCFLRVDGLPNQPACLVPCRDGLEADHQNVVGSARHDLLGATDWLFPRGIDHHEMFTGVPVVQGVVQKIVRKLAGLGTLPDRIPEPCPIVRRRTEVLVVGAGASGLAAASAAAEAGRRVDVLEARDTPGGRLRSGLYDALEVPHGPRLHLRASAEFVHRPDGRLEVVARHPEGIVLWSPAVLVLGTGGYPTPGLFANNDLPGIFDAHWAAELMTRFGVLPAERPVVCADPPLAERLERLLREAGAAPAALLPASSATGTGLPRIREAHGQLAVEAVHVETAGGTESYTCDGLILATPRAPAFELPVQAGAPTRFDPEAVGFVVTTGGRGALAPDVFACGSVTGARSPEAAADSGRTAGAAAAEAGGPP